MRNQYAQSNHLLEFGDSKSKFRTKPINLVCRQAGEQITAIFTMPKRISPNFVMRAKIN